MKKEQLMKKVGSMQQLAYVRPIEYKEGRSKGMNGFEIKNGPMTYTLMADKALDIANLSYKGTNLSFISKPGLQGRNHYDTNSQEAQRSIMGGMMFTCGLESICAPCTIEGKDYPMHGRMRTTPAEHVSSDAYWDGDDYILEVSGEMREAELFGENMVLRRNIKSVYGSKTFVVTDEIENQSYRDEPLMILYHINMGYPLLDEGAEILIPTTKVTPRDEAAKGHEGEYNIMDEPKDNEEEYVFIHDVKPDKDGIATVALINNELELGIKISYTVKNLGYFMEWKSTGSGDYVVGLEPANSIVYGRPYEEEHGTLHHIGSFEKEKNVITFTILEGKEEIENARKEIRSIVE